MDDNSIVAPISRKSNLEFYRIICMLLIVAHHFVVHSELTAQILPANPFAPKSLFLYLFGMWGKTCINCFLLITGYFMCKNQITLRKLLKLILEIQLYKITIYLIFLATGLEEYTWRRIIEVLMPVWGFNTNFISCFVGFYLTIPFWNILVNNMTKNQHRLLLLLLLGMYSVLGSIPSFTIALNFVTWFGVIFLIASYIRLYPNPIFERRNLWRGITLVSVFISMMSVIVALYLNKYSYLYVCDSNKLLAVLVAVSSFLWMINVDVNQSKLINCLGGSTFGVFLIHDSSQAMRRWLWVDFVDVASHYSMPFWQLVLFSIGVVLLVFLICVAIDRLRMAFLEKPILSWYDRKVINPYPLFQRNVY